MSALLEGRDATSSTTSRMPGVRGYGDVLRGNSQSNLIQGLAGRDRIKGRATFDVLLGGPGGDVIRGNRGDDYLYGEAGFDHLFGGPGKDQCWKSRGDDLESCKRKNQGHRPGLELLLP
jgi:Ca2+-binding RTX toxin-like protein